MLYQDTLEVVFNAFNGSYPRLNFYQIDQAHARVSLNSAYLQGQVGTRYGHSLVVQQSDGAVLSLLNWYFTFGSTPVSVLAYYTPTIGIRTLNLAGFADTTVMSATGAAGAIMAQDGQRLYAAFYDTTGRFSPSALGGGQVYGWNVGADNLFAPPIELTPSMSETATGVVTAGTHFIGYLMTTRNGYTTALCPVDSGGNFAPVAFTSSGGKNIQVSISGTFPPYMNGGTLQIVMTTVANPNRYYAVPGAIVSGAIGSVVLDVSISDGDLAATGTDVTAYQDLLTSSVSGTPPFFPSAVFTYSNRMGYVTIDSAGFPVVYMSDQNNYQHITADQHGIYFNNQIEPVMGIDLRGVCYIFSSHSTWQTTDNGDVPVTWTPPQLVDGAIGILSPTCVTVNPAQGYAFVASERGAYVFQGGIYPALPFSYNQQPDYERINWAVPTTVQVVDDQLNKRVLILAPLKTSVSGASNTNPITITAFNHGYQTGLSVVISGVGGNTAANTTATITVVDSNTFTIPVAGNGTYTSGGTVAPKTATHQLTWDYTAGDDFQSMKYSLNSMAAYNAGSVAVVQNNSTFLNEIWYGPSAAGYFIRQCDDTDPLPYRDYSTAGVATAISWEYQLALAPGMVDPNGLTVTIHNYHGAHIRAVGTAPLALKVVGLDGVIAKVPAASPIQLSVGPGLEYLVKWMLWSEQASLQMFTNTIDTFATVAMVRMYYSNKMAQRTQTIG